MKNIWMLISSSITRKYIMALTGFGLVGFVLVHLLGNLQIFLGKDMINKYAYHLHHLPPVILWGFRIGMGLCILTHITFALWLTTENIMARWKAYKVKRPIQASVSSLTMPITGSILFIFVAIHLLNFTFRTLPENYNLTLPQTTITLHDTSIIVFDVYRMIVNSFAVPWIAASYLIAMALLCMHLSHGVSSMFQSIGLRNEKWRFILDKLAMLFGWTMFVGFSAIPLSVMFGALK